MSVFAPFLFLFVGIFNFILCFIYISMLFENIGSGPQTILGLARRRYRAPQCYSFLEIGRKNIFSLFMLLKNKRVGGSVFGIKISKSTIKYIFGHNPVFCLLSTQPSPFILIFLNKGGVFYLMLILN